jgi:molecular chaperone DnaK
MDLSENAEALQRLKDAAEKAKIELSSSSSSDINLPYISFGPSGAKHLVRSLTKAKFEQLAADLIRRTIEPCKEALNDAGMDIGDIDEIIMVGGSTRIPAVQEAVGEFFNKKLNRSVNPDEVVALGASIQGGVLTGDVKDVLLLDVTPLSLGIETMGGVFAKLIEANTTIPTSKSQTFSTAQDNQPSVDIHVLQGERDLASMNRTIGRFNLDGIPPMRRGEPKIEVKFAIDAHGILSVSAKELATGKQQSIRIEASTGLSDDEIQRMKREAEENAESDKAARERIDKINEADSIIFQTEKQLTEYADKLPEEVKSSIETAVAQLKEAHQRQDIDAINQGIEAVNAAWAAASQNMQGDPNAQQQQQQANPDQGQADADSNGTDDVTDVEFEEVESDSENK